VEYRKKWDAALTEAGGYDALKGPDGRIDPTRLSARARASLSSDAASMLIDLKNTGGLGVLSAADIAIISGQVPILQPMFANLIDKMGGVSGAVAALASMKDDQIRELLSGTRLMPLDNPLVALDTTLGRIKGQFAQKLGPDYVVSRLPWEADAQAEIRTAPRSRLAAPPAGGP
jgi:hypothetical protein